MNAYLFVDIMSQGLLISYFLHIQLTTTGRMITVHKSKTIGSISLLDEYDSSQLYDKLLSPHF